MSSSIIVLYLGSYGFKEVTFLNGGMSGFQFRWALIDKSGQLSYSQGVWTLNLCLTVSVSWPGSILRAWGLMSWLHITAVFLYIVF